MPLEALTAGDTVLIYYRATPYKEKFVLAAVGTPTRPSTIRGVLGPNGERPILDGNGATTRAQLNYPSRVRGVIKIGASVVPFADGAAVMPQWIVIENLEIRGAHNPNTFTGPTGATETYTAPASAIYVEFGENITVRNCDMNNNGNGFFVFSSDTIASRNILVEGNSIHDNGNVGSNFEHNVYVEAIGITFEYNHLGALLPGRRRQQPEGSLGRAGRPLQLDRALQPPAGSGARGGQLAGARRSALPRDVRLRERDHRAPNSGNNDICFYGGDGGSAQKFRKGTLYFYNNTVISDRTDNTRLFRMATNDESIDARNNIAYVTAAGANLQVLDNYGRLTLTQNWFKTGWTPFVTNRPKGTITNNGTVTGTSPGFVSEAGQDYHLTGASQAINTGTVLNPAVLPDNDVVREYVKHLSSVARAVHSGLDIGAYEF